MTEVAWVSLLMFKVNKKADKEPHKSTTALLFAGTFTQVKLENKNLLKRQLSTVATDIFVVFLRCNFDAFYSR